MATRWIPLTQKEIAKMSQKTIGHILGTGRRVYAFIKGNKAYRLVNNKICKRDL